MKLMPVNFMKSQVNFGELDEGYSDDTYYHHKTPEAQLEISIKKQIIEEKYREKLSELASWADDDEMTNSDFWREYRRIEAEKDKEIRNLDLYC